MEGKNSETIEGLVESLCNDVFDKIYDVIDSKFQLPAWVDKTVKDKVIPEVSELLVEGIKFILGRYGVKA